MTDDDRRRTQQALADARARIHSEIAFAVPLLTAPARSQARPFVVGDRVLSLRSGQEGEIDDVRPADRDGVAWIWVRYDDGSRSAVRAADLALRPQPPAARR